MSLQHVDCDMYQKLPRASNPALQSGCVPSKQNRRRPRVVMVIDVIDESWLLMGMGPKRQCIFQVPQQLPTVAGQVWFWVDGCGLGALELTYQSWLEDKIFSPTVFMPG